jgi:hypothetical protein
MRKGAPSFGFAHGSWTGGESRDVDPAWIEAERKKPVRKKG